MDSQQQEQLKKCNSLLTVANKLLLETETILAQPELESIQLSEHVQQLIYTTQQASKAIQRQFFKSLVVLTPTAAIRQARKMLQSRIIQVRRQITTLKSTHRTQAIQQKKARTLLTQVTTLQRILRAQQTINNKQQSHLDGLRQHNNEIIEGMSRLQKRQYDCNFKLQTLQDNEKDYIKFKQLQKNYSDNVARKKQFQRQNVSLAKQIEQATSNVQYREQVVDKTIEDITKYIDKLDAKLLEQKYIIEEISEAENVENALEGFEKQKSLRELDEAVQIVPYDEDKPMITAKRANSKQNRMHYSDDQLQGKRVQEKNQNWKFLQHKQLPHAVQELLSHEEYIKKLRKFNAQLRKNETSEIERLLVEKHKRNVQNEVRSKVQLTRERMSKEQRPTSNKTANMLYGSKNRCEQTEQLNDYVSSSKYCRDNDRSKYSQSYLERSPQSMLNQRKIAEQSMQSVQERLARLQRLEASKRVRMKAATNPMKEFNEQSHINYRINKPRQHTDKFRSTIKQRQYSEDSDPGIVSLYNRFSQEQSKTTSHASSGKEGNIEVHRLSKRKKKRKLLNSNRGKIVEMEENSDGSLSNSMYEDDQGAYPEMAS